MAKKEPTEQKVTVSEPAQENFATAFADLGQPSGETRVESPAEAAVRKSIEENGQKKEALEEVKEKLVAADPNQLDPELLEQAAKSAADTLQAAKDVLKAAQAKVDEAQKECDRITLLQSRLPVLTDVQRNQQYLESQKQLRIQAVKESQARYQAMQKAGLLSAEEMQLLMPSVTPLDKAIAEQNLRKKAAERGPAPYVRRG